MNVVVYFTADEVDAGVLQGSTAVVVDVLRATSTVVEALANGARAIYPTVSAEEAIRLAASLGRDDTLLCGERRGLKIEGFDLGNSPAEFEVAKVGGRRLVMSTTNGTRALLASAAAARVLIGSFLNLSAVAAAVAGAEVLAIVCAGREGRFALEDAVCAGHLLARLTARKDVVPALNDAAEAALVLAGRYSPDAGFLARTAAGHALTEIGLASDLALCAKRDRRQVVPEMNDRVIRLTPGPEKRGREGRGRRSAAS
ncbi:MAG: 2-phosphosulfolactate phosphatase [Gemmatimonadetes bacterium]|nr:2-phosphosulfolactate phosphatase [Gemmatimonadota bacterium]